MKIYSLVEQLRPFRRECLDWLIPMSDPHLRWMLHESVTHYSNGARPHMALGSGVPDPPGGAVWCADEKSRNRLGLQVVVCARSVLGGLHREYSLAPALV